MAVYKQPKSKNWWYKFTWNGKAIRESTKQSNRRVAEQIEAAHKTALAKGEVGITKRKLAPTVAEFAERDFLPHIESQFADKTTTLAYYRVNVKHLTGHSLLAKARLDSIAPDLIAGMVEKRRQAEYEISSINRTLQVLRRMLHLAVEWGKIDRIPIKIRLLPGERQRDRVLTIEEENAYLRAATEIGERSLASYKSALEGIRAKQRGQEPISPADPFLLRDVATVLVDCGLRPEESYRLRWRYVSDGNLKVPFGKTDNATRMIPMTERVAALLEMRRTTAPGELIFPAPTKSEHINQSSLKKQHAKACKLSGVSFFVPYIFRHTCLTR